MTFAEVAFLTFGREGEPLFFAVKTIKAMRLNMKIVANMRRYAEKKVSARRVSGACLGGQSPLWDNAEGKLTEDISGKCCPTF